MAASRLHVNTCGSQFREILVSNVHSTIADPTIVTAFCMRVEKVYVPESKVFSSACSRMSESAVQWLSNILYK